MSHTNDPTATDLPVRDAPAKGVHKNQTKERQLVSALARKDLEDKYLTLREDYNDLKKLSRVQDEKMKQMATKLVRLFNDKKKLDGKDKGPRRDIETSDYIEDLQAQIRTLQSQNEQLKNKLSVVKHQLQSQGKRQTPYDRVKPRVQTGLTQTPQHQQRVKEQLRVEGQTDQKMSGRVPQPLLAQPRYGHSLLEESRIEKRELEDLVASLQEQITLLETNKEDLIEQSRLQQKRYEQSELTLQAEINELKKASIREGSEMIRLEREVKDKCTKLDVFQGKFTNLEQIFEKVKASNEKALSEMENLNVKLKNEQAENSSLRNKIRENDFARTSLSERDEQITDLKNENSLLKETHEKLLQSTFDAERERRFRMKERHYQLKISQLEALTKADVLEKNELLDKLSHQHDSSEKMEEEIKKLRIECFSQKQLYDDLAEKMKFFSKESNMDMNEVEEAILLIRSRKEKDSQKLHFLENVEDDLRADSRKELLQLQTVHADTVSELEKTRGMLQMQYKINTDYQKEVSVNVQKMEEIKKDCDTKMQEYAQMLDLRANRIKKLEEQLKDVAYGTKQYKITSEQIEEVGSKPEEANVSYELERGQNVFEIHIGKLTIKNDVLSMFGKAEPHTFVTIEFFEYEMQTTPVLTGQSVSFNFTSQFIVTVDDFFLHHIAKESAIIELHQAVGTEYKTLATSKLRLNDLIDKNQQYNHGVLSLYDINEKRQFAVLEYWIRLQVPMEQALRLYKERSKALGYITINSQKSDSHESSLRVDKEANELKVSILRCSSLKSSSGQPNVYCVYKFFDFADHDTEIITNSTNPSFNDERTFPVVMNEDLDNFLKTSVLIIYVFDDKDTDPTAIIGKTEISLIPLSKDKSICATFQLFKDNQTVTGTIDVALQWFHSYLPTFKVSKSSPKSMPVMPKLKIKENVAPSPKVVSPKIKKGSFIGNDITPEKLEEKPIMNETQKTVTFKEDVLEAILPAGVEIQDDSQKASSHKDSFDMKINKTPDENAAVKESYVDDLADDSGNNYESDASLMEKELRRTVEAMDDRLSPSNNDIGEDTLFEEPISDVSIDDDDDDDVGDDVVIASVSSKVAGINDKGIENEQGTDGLDSVTTSDSEGVVFSSTGARALSSLSSSSVTISIEVASLTLYENASLYKLEKTVQLYVAYRFLDEDPESLETPDSLPLPLPNRPIHYNFKKVFRIDKAEREQQFQMLMNMLLTEERLRFNVVAEPNDGDEDCEDIGFADVNFLQILQQNRDMFDEDIEVLDAEEELIGSLTISVEALEALQSLYD